MKNLLRSQKGQGLVEYGLIMVLVSIAAVAVMGVVGTQIAGYYTQVLAAF